MENIFSNTYPKLFYVFNGRYYMSYNIHETTVTGTDDEEHQGYIYDEIMYNNKPTLEKVLADISEVEVLSDSTKESYVEAYNTL